MVYLINSCPSSVVRHPSSVVRRPSSAFRHADHFVMVQGVVCRGDGDCSRYSNQRVYDIYLAKIRPYHSDVNCDIKQ